MQKIIFGRPEGGVSIMTPARSIEDGHLTDEEIFARAWKSLPQDAVNPQAVDAEQIPTDRTFQEAWERGGSKVQVNMDKARTIHMARIRAVRNAKLKELDNQTMQHLGSGNNAGRQAVEAQKQVLRDIPQNLDLSQTQTPEELKAIWPKELQ